MKTSREVRFWMSALSLSISAPLRPMMMPGRAVRMMRTQLVAGTLDLDRAHAGGLQLLAQLSLELDVFDQQFVIAALHEPARLHGLLMPRRNPYGWTFCPIASLYSVPPRLSGGRSAKL